jgi:hypothetical protein
MRGDSFRRQRINPAATLFGCRTRRIAQHSIRAHGANTVLAQLLHEFSR